MCNTFTGMANGKGGAFNMVPSLAVETASAVRNLSDKVDTCLKEIKDTREDISLLLNRIESLATENKSLKEAIKELLDNIRLANMRRSDM